MRQLFLLSFLFYCLLYSCDTSNKQELDTIDSSDFDLIRPKSIVPMGQPEIHTVNYDSLEEVKFTITKEKPEIGEPTTDIRTPIIKATITEIPVVDSSFKTVRLGEDVPSPKTYEIPNFGYKVQYGDTIYAPTKVKAKHSESQPIGSMLIGPNNVKDITYLDEDSGLPYSFFWCTMEDSKSYMWFGSAGLGLIRYNGRSFQTYDRNSGLSFSHIKCLLEDQEKNIWSGSYNTMAKYENGINRYDGDNFYSYTDKQGFSNYPIYALYQDSKGNIWVATQGAGILVYKKKQNTETVTKYTTENGLLGNIVNCFMEDKDGSIWIGTERGICNFDGKKFTSFTKEIKSEVESITIDANGAIWFSDQINLYKYNKSSLQKIEAEKYTKLVTSIKEDGNGCIWLATWEGLVYFDGELFRMIDDRNGLAHKMVTNLSKDKSGNLWAATFGGIHKLKPSSFDTYSNIANFSNKYINALANDKEDGLWLGSKNIQGIVKYQNNNFSHYFFNQGYTEFVFSDSDNNIWFGALKNSKYPLSKFDGKVAHRYQLEGFSDSNIVMGVTEDLNGNIWIASVEGLIKFDGKRMLKFDEKDGVPRKIFNTVTDKNGNLWLCSRNGLTMFDGENFSSYSVNNGLIDNALYQLIFDKDENIVLSSTKGLSLLTFNKDRSALEFSHNYSKENASTYDLSLMLIEDNEHAIWAGSNKGVNRLSPTGKLGIYTKTAFTKEDGFLAGRGLVNGVVLGKNNTIWWGARKGVVSLDLNKYDLEYSKPSIHLNEIEINEKFIDFHNLEDSTYAATIPFSEELQNAVGNNVILFENYPKEINLPYRLNHLNFKFSAIDWKSTNNLQYQYKLEGSDEDWNELTGDNFATYRKISPGSYTFKVKAKGKTGLWSDTLSYDFTITPPWWLTWWAKVLYLFIGVFLVYTIIKLRTNAIREEFAEKEHLWAITERQNKRFLDFSFVTSHNIRIAAANLSGIHNLIKSDLDPELSQMLSTTDYKLGNSIEHMNQLLHTDDFTKETKKEPCLFVTSINKAIDKNKSLINKQKAILKVDVPEDLEVPTLYKYLDNIVHQLIKNALIYGITDTNKTIEIFTKKENDVTMLVVKDYGLGIDLDAYQDDIFSLGGRFHPEFSDGEGLGLYISKNQIKTLGWDILVESQVNKGSTFKVICYE